MCESPGSHPELITESKSTTVNILAVLSLAEINTRGDPGFIIRRIRLSKQRYLGSARSPTRDSALLKTVWTIRNVLSEALFSSLTRDWVVHHIWSCSRTLVSSSQPRLPDLKPPAGTRLISKVLSSLKDSGTQTCLCGASVISQELLLLCLALSHTTRKAQTAP